MSQPHFWSPSRRLNDIQGISEKCNGAFKFECRIIFDDQLNCIGLRRGQSLDELLQYQHVDIPIQQHHVDIKCLSSFVFKDISGEKIIFLFFFYWLGFMLFLKELEKVAPKATEPSLSVLSTVRLNSTKLVFLKTAQQLRRLILAK